MCQVFVELLLSFANTSYLAANPCYVPCKCTSNRLTHPVKESLHVDSQNLPGLHTGIRSGWHDKNSVPVVSTTLVLQRRFHCTINCCLSSLGRAFGEGSRQLPEELLRPVQMTPQICLNDSGVERVCHHTCAYKRGKKKKKKSEDLINIYVIVINCKNLSCLVEHLR